MALGNLFSKLRQDKKEIESFLAIVITDELIQSAVWQVVEGKTELLTTGSPVEWDGDDQSLTELLSAADATVSSALEGLNKEPNQVIFGIDSSWVDNGKISPSKLALIKSICLELELKPLGFVEIVDSVIRYLRMQEGTPTTSILIQVFASAIVVTLVKLGKVEAKKSVVRGEDLVGDVEEALTAIKQEENLPSRFLVFNSMHSLDELVQNLVGYDWQKNLKFLHIPRIEALPKDIVIRSVAVGGGTEVAKSIGFEINEQTVETSTSPEPVELQEQKLTDDNFVPASDFGFDNNPPPVSDSHNPLEVISLPKKAVVSLPKIPTLPKFPEFSFKLPKYNGIFKPYILAVIALLFLISIYFSFVWFIPKAVLTVHLSPKDLTETVKITLSPSATAADSANSVVPAELVTHEVSGEDSLPTSGKKIIGDPARGEVTIFNRTSLAKTFNAGTILSAGSLKFTLDDTVTVASKSAGTDYVDVPGKATASVTAREIGENGNLPSATEFTLANFSKETYVAKNDSAFKGGNSKEIRVVSETDQKNLINLLTDKLSAQAQSELEGQIQQGVGIYLLKESAQLVDETYNFKVGAESEILQGKITISVRALKYQTAEIEQLVSTAIGEKIPPGYQKTLEPPSVEIGDPLAQDDDQYQAEAKVIIKLAPIIDLNNYVSSLRSATLSKAQATLSTIPGYIRTDIELSPSYLPERLKTIPKNINNITIKLVTD